MNGFWECLRQQLRDHPSMLPQDVVKLCYQAACGAEHLLEDVSGAKAFFEEEYAAVPLRNEPLYEPISDEVCRVNLGAWKRSGKSPELLFELFAGMVFRGTQKQRLSEYLKIAEAVLRSTDFDMEAWQKYLADYREQGMPAVRHSAAYREAEQPAYRIVGMEQLLSELKKEM